MKIAIFTLTKDRVEYTKKFIDSLNDKTSIPFDHYILDQGSIDSTVDVLKNTPQKNGRRIVYELPRNIGINRGVNFLIDKIGKNADIIIKFDNDMEIETENWLVKCIKPLTEKTLISPYINGLIQNRGGVRRIGTLPGGLSQAPFIGGMCMIGSSKAWKTKWLTPTTLHPNGGDINFCKRLAFEGFKFGYKDDVIINHQETSLGQEETYKEYFGLRKFEKETIL